MKNEKENEEKVKLTHHINKKKNQVNKLRLNNMFNK